MIIETAIALILIFSALVMFHELGHYLAARAAGIRVEEFAFGFGPKLLRLFKRGDTEYTVRLVPLGGFVRTAGMEMGEEDVADGLLAQPAWKRAAVFASGPIASFLLAVLAFLALGLIWGYPDGSRVQNRVAMVSPQTVASRIGLRAGDRIVEINGRKFTEGNSLTSLIHSSPGKTLHLVIKRNGEPLKKTAAPAYAIDYAGIEWAFYSPKVGKVISAPPPAIAKKTGIDKDDVLVSLDRRRIRSGEQMLNVIRGNGERPVEAVLKRGDKVFTARLTPSTYVVSFQGVDWVILSGDVTSTGKPVVYSKPGASPTVVLLEANGRKIRSGNELVSAIRDARSPTLKLKLKDDKKARTVSVDLKPRDVANLSARVYDMQGQFGFIPQPVLRKTGFGESIRQGIEITWGLVNTIVRSLAPSRIGESVGGPIMIAQQTSAMVALGPYYVVQMGGMLSMSLFFLNLLPIPVLDGGHLFIILIEAIRRKRLTAQQMQFATLVGLAIIGLIIVAVMWSDITKLSKGLVPQ